jgi:hypothetical protein
MKTAATQHCRVAAVFMGLECMGSTLVRAERREARSAGWIVVDKAEHYYCNEARNEAGMREWNVE